MDYLWEFLCSNFDFTKKKKNANFVVTKLNKKMKFELSPEFKKINDDLLKNNYQDLTGNCWFFVSKL